MIHFFQAVTAVLLAVILVLVLKAGNPGIGGLLSVLTCAIVLIAALSNIRPIADFLGAVEAVAELDNSLVKTLFKIVGISVTAEIAELICTDAGNHAMGKALQFLATGVIICLAIPMMTAFLELIEGILRGL